MKRLAVLAVLVMIGCTPEPKKAELSPFDKMVKLNGELSAKLVECAASYEALTKRWEKIVDERTYAAAELGYNSAKAGYSRKKLRKEIEGILAKQP